jgi:hypothetical protein
VKVDAAVNCSRHAAYPTQQAARATPGVLAGQAGPEGAGRAGSLPLPHV